MTNKEAAVKVLNTLTNAGHEAYFVGGAVRDTLLGLEPKDWDVCSFASAEQVAELFPETKMVGAHFGVALVHVDEYDFEVARFRVDGDYGDNRRPDSVTFTRNVVDDVMRRDFTVNALLMDADGKVTDHVGGVEDLKHRLLRTVGNPFTRFSEDALRMLRAVRFCTKLNFSPDPEMRAAMTSLASTVQSVSAERVYAELTNILTSGQAGVGLWLLHSAHLTQYVLPEYDALRDVKQNPAHHPEGDVMTHTAGLLHSLQKGCPATLAWATLMHDFGKPATFALHPKTNQPTFYGHEDVGAVMALNVAQRLKFSTDDATTVSTLVAQHMRFMNVKNMKLSKLKQFVRQPHFDQLLELHRLDALASNKDLSNYEFVVNFLKTTPNEELCPSKLLTGDDLVEMGLKPGPMFKTLLSALEDAQLEGTVTTRDAAVEFVKQHLVPGDK